MARAVSKAIDKGKPVVGVVGTHVLDIVTAGMYSDPLMALREYVQNAADAIDVARAKKKLGPTEGQIDISVSGRERSISIQDNGCGLRAGEAEARLGSIGDSVKSPPQQRGFRGIGRLGGLAYCDRLVFETRSGSRERVTVVEWNGEKMRKVLAARGSAKDVRASIKKIATIRAREAGDDPDHFMRVTMVGVRSFREDALLNIPKVREYLGRTGPVGYDPARFSFADQVQSHMSALPGWRTYALRVNGEPVWKPYADKIWNGFRNIDRVERVELLEFSFVDGAVIGRGWFAHTGFRGALPSAVSMRGMQTRQGNIAVGVDHLVSIYTEDRFATWQIGEIELADALRPNARRDGFEQTPAYERFLAEASLLGRRLSGLCRSSSKERSKVRRVEEALESVESTIEGAVLFVDLQHARDVLDAATSALGAVESQVHNGSGTPELRQRHRKLGSRLSRIRKDPPLLENLLDGRSLAGQCTKPFLRKLGRRILEMSESPVTVSELLLAVLEPFLKKDVVKALSRRRSSKTTSV